MLRKCKVCLEEKQLTEEYFPQMKNKAGKQFFRHVCKPCQYDGYKKWAQENKSLVKKLQEKWRSENKEYKRDWHQKNKRHEKERVNRRKKEEPLFNLKWKINALIYCSMRVSMGYSKNTQAYSLLGCSFEELLAHLGVTSSKDYDGKHLDHICPNDQAKTTSELRKLQHFSNLRLVPKEVNMAKGHKPTPEGIRLCRDLLGRDWEQKSNGV